MQFIKPDVSTICIGMAYSMGAVLLAGGAKGKRFMLPNSRAMIHQPSGGFSGQATDISIQAKEMLLVRERLNLILAGHTGQPIDRIQVDTERDTFLGPTESDRLWAGRQGPGQACGGRAADGLRRGQEADGGLSCPAPGSLGGGPAGRTAKM